MQFVYQRLAGDRELTVMRARRPVAASRSRGRRSRWRCWRSAAGYVLNIWVVPASLTAFREFQLEIRNRIAAFLLQEGVFTPVSDDLTVYVRARDPDGTLHGILVDDERQPNAPTRPSWPSAAGWSAGERAARAAVQRQPRRRSTRRPAG